MDRIVWMTAWLLQAFGRALGQKWSFLGLFLLTFLLSLWMLAGLGLLPEPATAVTGSATSLSLADIQTAAVPVAPEEPVKIEIPSIKLSATIANPVTTNLDSLDALLLKGAVRYPTSAKLGEDGNVVLFGHSSYLPVVRNLAYKTFDDIQKLQSGDVITVYSYGRAYTYHVRGVAKERADAGVIPLSVSGKVLTLATCNSFATKSDRFVVTADFVESHLLGV